MCHNMYYNGFLIDKAQFSTLNILALFRYKNNCASKLIENAAKMLTKNYVLVKLLLINI